MLKFFRRIGVEPVRSLEQWIELSRSYSGYEREAAVHALRSLREGSAIPCLLVRANDWVPVVRDAARLALADFLSDEFASDWIAALGNVIALQRAQRASHDQLLTSVAALLAKPQHLPSLLKTAVASGQAVKRYIFALQCGQVLEPGQRTQLLLDAISGNDVLIARQALAFAQSEASDDGRRHLANAACQSRFSEVRVEGLRQVLASGSEPSRELARSLCLDRSGSVRALALHAIRAWHDEPLVLKQALAQFECQSNWGRSRAVALKVFCDLNPNSARRYCEQVLQEESASMRCVAFAELLAMASEEEKDDLILRALADPSSRVQRVAAEVIRRGALPPPSDAVLAIALQHGNKGALARAISILRHYSYWTRLVCLLRGMHRQVSAEDKTVWLNALAQWNRECIRNFVTPSPAQQQEVEQLWQGTALHMPQSLREHMSFHLSAFGISTGPKC